MKVHKIKWLLLFSVECTYNNSTKWLTTVLTLLFFYFCCFIAKILIIHLFLLSQAARKIKFKPTDEASSQESKFIRKSDTSSLKTSEKQSGDGVKTDSTDSLVKTVSVMKTTEDEEEAGSSLDSKATKDEKQAGSSVDSNYDINKSFKLDFNINKEDDVTENKISNDENQEDGCRVGENSVISQKINSANAGSNTSDYFKMSTSDNSFRFNFKVSWILPWE